MAFKISKTRSAGPESPEVLLRDLKTKKIAGPLADQADLWRVYQDEALEVPDVALHLPTGGGKTLVGLVLAEWRRRSFGERVVYLCPTKQLVHQVAHQALNNFGIPVAPLVGSKHAYDRSISSRYQSGELVAVTTYSSLFNSYPFFDDPHIIVLDDAHAAEQYISNMWSLSVEMFDHPAVYGAIAAALRAKIPLSHYQRLVDPNEGMRDRGWVDKVPTPVLFDLSGELVTLLDQVLDAPDHKFVWSTIRDHILSCHLYMSAGHFLIRPIIPPTSTHAPFNNAKQRIYMSATLGEAGELERITGRFPIRRLAPKTGWEKQTIGRRYFMMPDRSLDDAAQMSLCKELIAIAGRAVVLTPDDRSADEFRNFIQANSGAKIYGAQDIERSKSDFTNATSAVAIVANRYDGIDFPEDDCRLLFVEGLPKATNLYEKFLITRLSSSDLLRVRILTRMVQAFGRCTRSDNDYSAVVLRGEELSKYILSNENRLPLHPELQAELNFGIEQSKDASIEDFVENFRLFLNQGEEWRDANQAILDERVLCEKKTLDGAAELAESVQQEILYVRAMWAGDYKSGLEAARGVLGSLNNSRLRGYRALWFYLAGSAAWLAHVVHADDLERVARENFVAAQRTEKTLSWLGSLTKIGLGEELSSSSGYDPEILQNIERIEALFDRLGSMTDFKYSRYEGALRAKLLINDAGMFEQGHVLLGELLGYSAGNRNGDASPDPWWRASEDFCLVFEDYTEAQATSAIPAKKARQAFTHPNWIRSQLVVAESAEIVPILVSPCTEIEQGAVPHMNGVIHWSIDDLRRTSEDALALVRELRRDYPGPGDIAWRAMAAERLRAARLSPREFVEALRQRQVDLKVRGA